MAKVMLRKNRQKLCYVQKIKLNDEQYHNQVFQVEATESMSVMREKNKLVSFLSTMLALKY